MALAQINTIVGDFAYNENKVKTFLEQARKQGADVVLFPELVLTGYPPEDLLLKESFLSKNVETLKRVVRCTKGITAVIGYAEPVRKSLYNAAAVAANGRLRASYRKMLLPNYGVFDEKRYFQEGSSPVLLVQGGVRLGVTVCEDIWEPDGPGKELSEASGADVILNISSSPYHKGKGMEREEMIRRRARRYRAYMVYANLVGGQDELVFDGQSLVMGPEGRLRAHAPSFEEALLFADLEIAPKGPPRGRKKHPAASTKTYRLPEAAAAKARGLLPEQTVRRRGEMEELHAALVLGTRDYILKNGFKKVVIGLSGGIDSSLTAAVACDALGAENVAGVLMPSPHSSRESLDDAHALAKRMGISTHVLPIEPAMRAYETILCEVFQGTPPGIAEENIQARIRGNLLMALSNKFGWLVLTTGNKSEVSVGYCTLYGDMAGGFAVLKDVPKLWVYKLAEYVNAREGRAVIPESVLRKAPSAELRPHQKDTDSLPPYSKLDPVLNRYIEDDLGVKDLQGLGLSREQVRRIVDLVDKNEYKRRQAPPGVRITPKAFGKDRRLPITNHFKG